MVKLIRLTSNDPDGIFDNTFKQEILIKPNSKIALKSLSLQVENKIIIDSSNDQITFQLGDGLTHKGPRAVKLTHNEYSATTAPLLLNDMNIKFNAALDTSTLTTNRDIGIEVKVNNDTPTSKTKIDFNVVKLNEYFDDIIKDKGTIPVVSTLTSPNKVFRATASTANPPIGPAPGECFLYNNVNICKGGGIFRTKILTLGAEVLRHGIIGFMDTNPDDLEDGEALDINKIVFGVIVNGNDGAQVYQMIKNGIVSPADTNVLCKPNDFVEIGISKGELEARVYDVNAQFILNTDVYNFNNLFPVIVFEVDSPKLAFTTIRYTPNPYIKNQSNFTAEIADVETTPPRQGTILPSNHFLEFEGESLANFLGFTNVRIPRTGFTLTSRFIVLGDNIFKPNNLSDAFILEMLNIGLDSYDGQIQSRASYLSIIPKDDNDNFIMYDTPYPVYIDINNFQALSLRNIKCRVLNNDLSALAMVGLGTIVLLISD